MKIAFTILALSSVFTSFAQHPTFVNDTAKYNGKSYVVGDTITLGYGSKPDKSFAFISMGSLMTGASFLGSNCSKEEAIINRINQSGNKVAFRAKFINYPKNPFGGNSLFIDIEGAIDNKELLEKK